MAFDFYADFRTLSTVPIRSDSWMGAETSGYTFAGEVLIESGATLTLWQGTEIAFSGGLTIEPGGMLVIEEDVVVTVGAGETLFARGHVSIAPGATLQFGQDAGLKVFHLTAVGTESDPIVFNRRDALQAWSGLRLLGGFIPGDMGDSWPHHLEHVRIEGAEVGVDVRTAGAGLSHVELIANGVGLMTDVVQYCFPGACLPAPRSNLGLHRVLVEGSADRGLSLRNAEVALWESTVRGNAGHGVFVQNAALTRFSENVIERNGMMDPGTRVSSGLVVSTNAEVDAARRGDVIGFPGLNRFADNMHEIIHGAGGYLFLGQDLDPDAFGHHNAIVSSSRDCWVVNHSGSLLWAELNYWGSPNGPPAGTICGPSPVSYLPFHDTDETGDSGGGYRPVAAGPLFAVAGGPAGEAGRGNSTVTEALRAEIRRVRGQLVENTGATNAPLHVQELAGLHRRDAGDQTGEWVTSHLLLTDLMGSLGDPVPQGPPGFRRAAERSAVVLLQRALARQDYDTAGELLALNEPLVESSNEARILALTAIHVDEAFGRFDEALARIEVLLASLGEDEGVLEEELSYVAGLLAAKRDESGTVHRGAPVAPVAAVRASEHLPTDYSLAPAYPNPTSGTTTLPLSLPEAADVSVTAYDLLGRRVAVLADQRFEAGRLEVGLDGSGLSAGVYVVRAEMTGASQQHVFTQRVTVVR